LIVARHEVPGLEFGHFKEQKPTARPEELGLLGVERGSPGPKGPAPKGLKNLAQGLPWVFGLRLEALKGRPLTRRQGNISRNAGGPFRAPQVGARFPG